jgi:hydroxymethylbilane synthase
MSGTRQAPVPNALRIGTRGSALALCQARQIAETLQPLISPRPIELVAVETTGDRLHDEPLERIGGDGIFTKEIQRALLQDTVDVAVHSLKDLPTARPQGLTLAAVPARGPAGDVFISRRHRTFDGLPPGARVATGSLRRRAMALHRRPDLRLVEIRGNIETRLRKLQEQDLDGLILARAGLERLGYRDAITELLSTEWFLPAVGQGALGLECRGNDDSTRLLLESINDGLTWSAVSAERALLAALGGGCLMPLGVVSQIAGDQLALRSAVLRADGRERIEGQVTGEIAAPQALGQRLAEDLLARGAGRLLESAATASLGQE